MRLHEALLCRVRGGSGSQQRAGGTDRTRQSDPVAVVGDVATRTNSAILGAMLANYAKTRGIEALVVDGTIRDVEELAALDLAVVARGATPNGSFRSGPGEIGQPISCGELSIAPGDLLLGDQDGVLVVPKSETDDRCSGRREVKLEQSLEIEVAAGKWNRDWVDEALAKLCSAAKALLRRLESGSRSEREGRAAREPMTTAAAIAASCGHLPVPEFTLAFN
jgi:predicted RecA/RadA family phage recombinase